MNFELAEQSIQYTFGNKRYTNGLKSRMIKNSLDDVILVQKQRVIEAAE